MKGRVRRSRTWLWIVAAAGACGSPDAVDRATGPSRSAAFQVIVSAPVTPSAALLAGRPAAGDGAPTVVYVSLAPGSVPDGVSAEIRDLATGASSSVVLIDGGFDPVALPAREGDTLDVGVRQAAGAVTHASAAVSPIRRLVVVRTQPPPRKTDVPINALLVVVFSEPVAPGTVTPQTVQLDAGGDVVPGTVTLTTDGLQVGFHPDSMLAPLAAYTLTISSVVADVEGVHLDGAVLVQFQTGVSVVPAGPVPPSVSAGFQHTCAVATSGEAYCWGANEFGELGIGYAGSYLAAPARVSGGLTFSSVSAGSDFTCGLVTTGAAYCWGQNASGELGTGDTIGRPAPVPVFGGLTFATLNAGPDHTCGVTRDGRAYCWGNGSTGQLGSLNYRYNMRSTIPVRVDKGSMYGNAFLAPVSATGLLHSCTLDEFGNAYCWGTLVYEVEALATNVVITQWSSRPTLVPGAPIFKSLSTGLFHSCGITVNGAARCWGTNSTGQLGTGDLTSERGPVAVAGGLKFEAISSGQGGYTCGLAAGGLAYCWGANDTGQLGSASDTTGCPLASSPRVPFAGHLPNGVVPCSTAPVRAAAPLTFASLSTGTVHTCGITLDGMAYCWGANSSGQLGDGSTTQSSAPVLVPLTLVRAAQP